METQVIYGGESKMANPQQIYDLCERLGLMWAVKKEHLFLPNGVDSGYFGVVRQDNNSVFQSVKDSYEVYQNWEMAEIVTRVAESLGRTVERGGMFDGGGKTYIQIEMPSVKVNGDQINRWSTAINSFDGSTSLRWGTQSVTIVCQNTFWKAYNLLKTSIKHTRNMRDAVERSLRALETIEESDKTLFELFINMADTKATTEQIKRVINVVTGVDVNKTEAEAKGVYSTRKLNQAQNLSTSVVTELSRHGQSLWGLWCGITHYTTHKASSENAREKSKLMGSLQRVDEEILEEMRKFIQQGAGVLVS